MTEQKAEMQEQTATTTTTTQAAPADSSAAIAAATVRAERAEKALQEIAAKSAEQKQQPQKQETQTHGSKEIEEMRAKLAALEQDANLGREYKAKETERIAKASEKMPAPWRAVLEKASDLGAKADLVALYEAQTQTTAQATTQGSSPVSSPARQPLPQGAPVSATTAIDLVAMLASREISPAEAARRYPKEYDAQIRSTLNGKSQQSRGMFG